MDEPLDQLGQVIVSALGGAATGHTLAHGQLTLSAHAGDIVRVMQFLRDDERCLFWCIIDITAVDWPEREKRFDVVYHLLSPKRNQRIRVKVQTDESTPVPSVISVYRGADWFEREVYDLFGVVFHNHPDLRRILLPPDWDGHPLRKDYPLEFVENRWTEEHLPEFTDVQKEQLEQRRAYGLEMLSVPQEREVRSLFRSGKEVMPKDK